MNWDLPSDSYAEVIALLTARDTHPERRKHRLAIEQYSYSEGEFFFTICARHQWQPFIDPQLAQQIIDAILWRREHHHWRLFCYCLMPDHLHLLLKLSDEEIRWYNAGARGQQPEGVLDHIGQFKSYTTNQIWRKMGREGVLWQKSSYDRIIRYNDKLDFAVSYVLNNPIRRGLVDNWMNYPYSAIIDSWL